MIVPVREGAGLGHPPKHFTTNANESINKVIKKALNYEERNWDKFCDNMLSLVNLQYQELEKCVLRTSEYHFSSSFSHLELPLSKWNRLSPEQRKKHLEQVLHVSMQCPHITDVIDEVEVQESSSSKNRRWITSNSKARK